MTKDVTTLAITVAKLKRKLAERDRIIDGLIGGGRCGCKRTWAGTLTEECHWCWARRQVEKLRSSEESRRDHSD